MSQEHFTRSLSTQLMCIYISDYEIIKDMSVKEQHSDLLKSVICLYTSQWQYNKYLILYCFLHQLNVFYKWLYL